MTAEPTLCGSRSSRPGFSAAIRSVSRSAMRLAVSALIFTSTVTRDSSGLPKWTTQRSFPAFSTVATFDGADGAHACTPAAGSPCKSSVKHGGGSSCRAARRDGHSCRWREPRCWSRIRNTGISAGGCGRRAMPGSSACSIPAWEGPPMSSPRWWSFRVLRAIAARRRAWLSRKVMRVRRRRESSPPWPH